MDLTLHQYAQHLLRLPDGKIVAQLQVMERNADAPPRKRFAAKVVFFYECDTGEQALAFILGDWETVANRAQG